MRTGVRLHDGSVVTLEEWGATQVQADQPLPSLSAEPIPEPTPTPTGPSAAELAEIARLEEVARMAQEFAAMQAAIANLIAQQQMQAPVQPPVIKPLELPRLPDQANSGAVYGTTRVTLQAVKLSGQTVFAETDLLSVLGEVIKPGMVPTRNGNLSLNEALAEAGGLSGLSA